MYRFSSHNQAGGQRPQQTTPATQSTETQPTKTSHSNTSSSEEQWTEASLKAMTNIELKAILQGLGLKKSGKKAELVDRILGREVVVEKKKKPQWRNSKARALLEKMLMDKHSPVHKMTWREIHASHPWFQEYEDLTNFVRENVKRLREANKKKVKVVQKDNQIIQRELRKFPRNSRTRG